MDIPSLLENILDNTNIISNNLQLDLNTISRYENIEDYSENELLTLTFPFILAKLHNNLSYYIEYIELIDKLDLYKNKGQKETIISDLKISYEEKKFSRNTKLQIHRLKNHFNSIKRDFDDREWIIQMLKYIYIVSIEEIVFLHVKEDIQSKKKRNEVVNDNGIRSARTWAIEINKKNERKNILVDRNKPTISLDDYADMLLAQMSQEQMTYKEEIKIDDIDDENKTINELTLKQFRERDEFNDSGEKNSGNRKGMG